MKIEKLKMNEGVSRRRNGLGRSFKFSVFNLQFSFFNFPFMTVLHGETGRRARWIYLLACIGTTLIYPIIGLRLVVDYNNLGGILLLNYRNALLVALYFLLVFGPETAAEPAVTGTNR